MTELKNGDTVRIDMGAQFARRLGPDVAEVRWHNSGFVGPVPIGAFRLIGSGRSSQNAMAHVEKDHPQPDVGATLRVDMGAEFIRPLDDKSAEVRWHNSGFVGPVPIGAFGKVLPGRSSAGAAMSRDG